MKELVLLGSFAVIAIYGYCAMSKLDLFLEELRAQKREDPGRRVRLNIATSSLNAVPSVWKILKDIRRRHPGAQCSLSVGLEREVLKSLDSGESDVAIVSPDSESGPLAQWKRVSMAPQSCSAEDGSVSVESLDKQPQGQKVLWKRDSAQSLALEFVHRLCCQKS